MFTGIIRNFEPKDLQAAQTIIAMHWQDDFSKHILKRLSNVINQSPETTAQRFRVLVAEENNEIVGISIDRIAPEHMQIYSVTKNPWEFYVLAVKYKGKHIGSTLRDKVVEDAKAHGYSEVVFYSAESHKDAWPFHDNSEFKRVGPMTAPNGEHGYLWQLIFE